MSARSHCPRKWLSPLHAEQRAFRFTHRGRQRRRSERFGSAQMLLLGLAQAMDLSPGATLVALLFGAAPTAASGYTLARQMGGDAPLMAAMITLQTALCQITLPLTVLCTSPDSATGCGR